MVKGVSATLLLGEKCMSRDHLNDGLAQDDCGWAAGWDCDILRWGYQPPSPDYNGTPSSSYSGPPSANGAPLSVYASFGSSHQGSSNYALCDGSVRAISYSISPTTFASCLRAMLCWRPPIKLQPA